MEVLQKIAGHIRALKNLRSLIANHLDQPEKLYRELNSRREEFTIAEKITGAVLDPLLRVVELGVQLAEVEYYQLIAEVELLLSNKQKECEKAFEDERERLENEGEVPCLNGSWTEYKLLRWMINFVKTKLDKFCETYGQDKSKRKDIIERLGFDPEILIQHSATKRVKVTGEIVREHLTKIIQKYTLSSGELYINRDELCEELKEVEIKAYQELAKKEKPLMSNAKSTIKEIERDLNQPHQQADNNELVIQQVRKTVHEDDLERVETVLIVNYSQVEVTFNDTSYIFNSGKRLLFKNLTGVEITLMDSLIECGSFGKFEEGVTADSKQKKLQASINAKIKNAIPVSVTAQQKYGVPISFRNGEFVLNLMVTNKTKQIMKGTERKGNYQID